KHLLDEFICITIVVIVLGFALFAYLSESHVPQFPSCFPEGLECILGLPRHDYVVNQTQKVLFPGHISQVSSGTKCCTDGFLESPFSSSDIILVLLQHLLMSFHLGIISGT